MKGKTNENEAVLDDKNQQEEIKHEPNNIESIIPEEVLEGIPEEERNRIKSIIHQTSISGIMRGSNPISEKVTSEHISILIENTDNQDKRDRAERKSDKNYQIIFLLIALAFMAFLIVFLKDDKELLYKIIIAVISFIGGFGIGKTINKKTHTGE